MYDKDIVDLFLEANRNDFAVDDFITELMEDNYEHTKTTDYNRTGDGIPSITTRTSHRLEDEVECYR